MKRNKIRKLNNKGNTLAIVIIGIFILSILGTLILGITATNYRMKLANKKSEMTFYYAEKAVDEIYAGIGTEVMECVRNSYEKVLANYVKVDSMTGSISKLTQDEANDKFKTEYNTLLHIKYPITPDLDKDINNIFTRLSANISTITGYTTTLTKNADATKPTEVVYDTANNRVYLNNVCVECVAGESGYYSSITTDFVINMPNINFDMFDSGSSDFKEFFSYAIIAQGKVGSTTDPSLKITGSEVTINGNVYAGSDLLGRKDSILIDSVVKSVIKANTLVAEGSLVVKNSKADFSDLASDDTTDIDTIIDTADTLQLWAGDIKTENPSSGTGSTGISIVGNCIVSDDMEINADNSTINIKGNYFGYGFKASAADDNVEADSGTITGFTGTSLSTKMEHEERSAIIVNGENADVDMSGVKKLILAGRSYVDLDEGGQYRNASYMTGESVSVKGNQQMYLADSTLLNGISNPISYADFTNLNNALLDGEPNYSQLGLDSNKVVAKKTGSQVYFYNKENNPKEQTEYFVDTFASNAEKSNNMKTQINKLGVKNLKFRNDLSSYTVGAIVQVDGGDVVVPSDGKFLYGANGITKTKFFELIKDIKIRKSYLTTNLTNLSSTILGNEYVSIPASTDTNTVYEKYINKNKVELVTGRIEKQNLQRGNPYSAEICDKLAALGFYNPDLVNVGYIITNESGTSAVDVTLDAGIIIANRPVNISKDFTGLVVCNGNIKVYGSCRKITAAKDLVECMCDNISDISKYLNGYIPNGSLTGSAVEADNLTYEDIVDKITWRKNTK